MSEKKILEGNKLIAEFMDAKIIPNQGEAKIEHFVFDNDRLAIWDLKYNSSWDWLIPVVEKIEKLGYHTRICFDDFGSWMQIHYGLSVADTDETKALNQHGTKIENTFNSVVEFIKWYNKNGKKSKGK